MTIQPNIARQVVSELYQAIRQPINLMDETGRIIASTDASRIGTVHSAACQAIRENMECLIVRADDEYAGSRIGVNVPLHYNGTIVGVVGITGGNYEELSRYVHLIRTTTEALLREQNSRLEETGAEKHLRALWESALFAPGEPERDVLCELAEYYAIDPAAPCGIIVAEPLAAESGAVPHWRTAFQRALRGADVLVPAYDAPGGAVLFSREPDETVEPALQALSRSAAEGGAALAIGYTRRKDAFLTLRQSFQHAKTACQVARQLRAPRAVCYDDLTLELLLPDLSGQTRQDYLRRVFAGQSEETRRRFQSLLSAFYACNGSVTQTAERLFVHKNTVQYQLRKIAELTGLDPRRLDHAAVFQMALLLDAAEP